MSPTAFGVGSSRAYGIAKATALPPGAAVIPTDSLYSHWDFSLLSDPVGTIYTADSTGIPGASGTSIGAVANTPQLFHRSSGSGGSTTISTQNGLKCLNVQLSTSTNNGAFLQSSGNAFPNISLFTNSYTWIAVWRHTTSIPNWTRIYRWYLDGYNYDFNHATWWLNVGVGELNPFNYAASQRYAPSVGDSNRSSTSIVHYDIATIFGNSYEVSWNTTSNTIFTAAGSNLTPGTYSTQPDANRYFQIRPINYSNSPNYPTTFACEFAFYNRYMGATERSSVITALKAKWG